MICIFAGYLARYPLGGHVLAQIHLMAGLQRLGYEVIFVEHHGWDNACYNPRTNTMTDDPSYGLSEIRRYFEWIGLRRWCYMEPSGKCHGLPRAELAGLCRQAAMLFSPASTTWIEEFRECRERIFLDMDPGFTQFKMSPTSCAGYASPCEFNHHFTIAQRMDMIPSRGLNWKPTRMPVVLDLVKPQFTPEAKRFTTVMSWTAYGSTTYEGVTYGQKDVEMTKFIDLPGRVGSVLEVALGGPNAPAEKLRVAGWSVTGALEATMTVESYLDYIGRSRGEFSVAKEGYVKTRCGWFSDRTVNYLAKGKPAIVQDTGFSEFIPCGEGLFAFKTADDVAASIEIINRNYEFHCRAARRIAEEYFDSDRVVKELLATL